MGEKVHNKYLMGLIFSTSWRVAPTKIIFPMGKGVWFFFSGSTHTILSIGTKNREGGTNLTVFYFPSGGKKKTVPNP